MTKKENITLQRITYLRGPNVWTYRPVLEVWLDLGELEDWPSHQLPGFNDRLTAMLPALIEHHCGVGERGGFLQRLEEGTWMGHVLEHVVIELLNLAGMPTGFGQTRSTSQHGVYRMVFRARDEQVARTALAEGHALLMAAVNSEAFDAAAAVGRVREKIDDCYLGPSTASIVGAATDRRIPHIRLNDGNLVQIGYGSAQRRIWTAETDLTSAIAEGIAGDKDLTKTLLKACGVPVPEGEIVDSPEAAWRAAEDIGGPVVIKPTDGNHGRGVSLDLRLRGEIEDAYRLAEQHGSEVLVERFIPGEEHRLLVVGGRVVAAARGESAWVVGDGRSTVVELIDSQINSDPRRGTTEDFPLNRIDIRKDDVVQLELQRQGLSGEGVPAAGRKVMIQRNGNVAIDCTDQVHPEVDHIVSLAARVVGLDIAGIDVVAEDISKPLHAQGGAIVEVNAGPGLLMHLKPAEGMPRPVGRDIVNHLFAEDASGRIPVVGVAGSQGATDIAQLVAWLVHLSGRHVGLACRDGLFLAGRRVGRGDCANWASGHRLLMNREVQTVVIENGASTILDDGLPYDRCHVGVVTDLGGAETLDRHDIRDTEQMPRVLRTQVDVVLPEGAAVLNADDERITDMARLSDGEVLFYSLLAEDNETVAAHRAQGGRVVLLRASRVVLATGTAEVVCVDLQRRRILLAPSVVLAALAAGWALGIAPELMAAGLETFASSPTRS
ncbi:MAG: cyanophycin synthetase [Pseudomonadota bacterium]|jgi:cyanophycin synthetase